MLVSSPYQMDNLVATAQGLWTAVKAIKNYKRESRNAVHRPQNLEILYGAGRVRLSVRVNRWNSFTEILE
jgi:hypothetical protein